MAASNLDTSTTADSLIEVVKSSFLDGNYIFDDDWMVSSIKSNSCVDINEYVNKITQLQIKDHPIDEIFAYLLFSKVQISQNAALAPPTCSFMNLFKHKPWSPSQNLGFFDQGIVLFKSADPLLKLAKMHKLKAPKIVVYKVIAGRKKSQICTLQNVCCKQPSLENDFDSCDVKLDSDVNVNYLDLNIHRHLSELFVHDFKTVKRDGMLIDVVKSCPRQVLPFAVLNLQAIDVSPRRTDVTKVRSLRSQGNLFPSFCRYMSCCSCIETTPLSKRSKPTFRRRRRSSLAQKKKERSVSSDDQRLKVLPQVRVLPFNSNVSVVNEIQDDIINATKDPFCTAMAQQQGNTAEFGSRTNCGQCIEDLLSGLSDQSLLDLCKDAGLLSASSQSFSDYDLTTLDNQLSVPDIPSKIAVSSESSSSTRELPLETVENANMSLLDDICKLIEDDLDTDLTASSTAPILQQDQVISETNVMTSHVHPQTESSSLQQENIVQLFPHVSSSSDCSVRNSDDSSGQTSFGNAISTSCADGKVADLQSSQKIVAARPSKRPRKKNTRKKVKNLVKKVEHDVSSLIVNSRKHFSGVKAANLVESLNKNFEDIEEERSRKERLQCIYQPRCQAEFRYIASPTRKITTLSSVPVLDNESFKRKCNSLRKMGMSKSLQQRNQTSFCDIISAELADKATQDIVAPIKSMPMPTSLETAVGKRKKSPTVVVSHSEFNTNRVATNYLARSAPCRCTCQCKKKSRKLHRKIKSTRHVRCRPYAVVYRIVPCIQFRDYRCSKFSFRFPSSTACSGPFLWIRNKK